MNIPSTHRRLTAEEREEISRLLALDWSYRQIAQRISRSPSTISREITRLRYSRSTYRATFAHEVTLVKRRRPKHNKLTRNPELAAYVMRRLLKDRWSPQQIAARIQIEYPEDTTMRVSHETIYTYVFCFARGELKKQLRDALRQHKSKRGRTFTRAEQRARRVQQNIPDLISIEERPPEVEDRIIPGHWEGDLIMGQGNHSALGTLVERTTRTVILVPIESKHAEHVALRFAEELESMPVQMKLTLTYDRGSEMARHKLFSAYANMQVYFADPQSPWQRGTNENTNGLIRQFFPKSTNFKKVSIEEVKQVQDLLNSRPRKALEYATPYERSNTLLAEKGDTTDKALVLR